MRIVNIQGGLGNQLFQYVFGQALSRAASDSVVYSVDMLSVRSHNGLNDLVEAFDVVVPTISGVDITREVGMFSNIRVRQVSARFPGLIEKFRPDLCFERGYRYDVRHLTNQGRYYHGYWQSFKYADHVGLNACDALPFNRALMDRNSKWRDVLDSSGVVAVHVRRGDYLLPKNAQVFATCGIEYYDNAIKWLADRRQVRKIFVFSDDPKWVSEFFPSCYAPVHVWDKQYGTNAADELWLMSVADSLVTANSTFSWWAAALGKPADRLVLTPDKWFRSENLSELDLLPNRWVRVAGAA
jgi:Glycosyl transferase family 11